MSIYLSGDLHSIRGFKRFSNKSFPENKKMTKDDYVIILGDFGVLWENIPSPTEKYLLDFFNNKNFTTLFLDGNHENFIRLSKLPQIEKFGSTVGAVSDSIYHLKRGNIYNISNKTFFVMGGAESIDKENRIEFLSWWREEVASYSEMDHAISNLKKNNNSVDYILTHTAPSYILKRLLPNTYNHYSKDPMTPFLDHIYKNISFKKWFCGHLHINFYNDDKINVLFENIVKLL